MTVHRLPAKKKPAAEISGYRLEAKGSDEAVMYIYGAIGGDWFGEGVTAKQVADDLKALGKVKEITVRINSEGGNVFDGKAIYSLLVENKATINVKIDGLAASAASFIAMAGNSIEISEGAFVMIHDAYGVSFGRAEDMRAYATLLDTVNGTIREVYSARTKQTDAQVNKWMKDETWFTAKEAVANGFADKMTENLKVAASINNPRAFKKLPAVLRPQNARACKALDRIAVLTA
jgi:ATP-dependent Clp protease protease subunit